VSLLRIQELSCIRDQRLLFENLTFTVSAGSIWQIEGPNGAGKTSLLRILCGLALPQQGEVCWRDDNIQHARVQYYSELLYIGHQPALKEELTAIENLHFYQALANYQGDIEQALERVGLYGFEDQPVRSLSAGQRRRVGLARLWLSEALLWILDEPFTAIDSAGIQHLEQRLQQHLSAGGCIVLTSHQAVGLASVNKLQLT